MFILYLTSKLPLLQTIKIVGHPLLICQLDVYKDELEKCENKKNLIDPTGGVGGAKESIKCLHSHLADELATNKNIIGKIVVEAVGGFNCEDPCINENYEKNANWKSKW